MAFPLNPINGQIHIINSASYTYDSTIPGWKYTRGVWLAGSGAKGVTPSQMDALGLIVAGGTSLPSTTLTVGSGLRYVTSIINDGVDTYACTTSPTGIHKDTGSTGQFTYLINTGLAYKMTYNPATDTYYLIDAGNGYIKVLVGTSLVNSNPLMYGNFTGITSTKNDTYICNYTTIWKLTNGVGSWVDLNQLSTKRWQSLTAIGEDIYASSGVYGDAALYKMTGGVGNFERISSLPIGATELYIAVWKIGDDIYTGSDAGKIYKMTGGYGDLVYTNNGPISLYGGGYAPNDKVLLGSYAGIQEFSVGTTTFSPPTANSPDSILLDRAQHIGTQPASTISDFDVAVQNNTKMQLLNDGYLGFFADEASLNAAHGTAKDGDFAIIGSTKSFWLWNTFLNVWIASSTSKGLTDSQLSSLDNVIAAGTSAPINKQIETFQIASSGATILIDNAYDGTDLYATKSDSTLYRSSGSNGGYVKVDTLPLTNTKYVAANQLNGDIYISNTAGAIYKQTGGVGIWVTLKDAAGLDITIPFTRCIEVIAGDLYVGTSSQIFKQTGCVGDFVSLGQISRNWTRLHGTPNGDIYAIDDGTYTNGLYKMTGGVGSFVSMGAEIAAVEPMDIASIGSDIYIFSFANGIYKLTQGSGTLIHALSNTTRYTTAITVDNEIHMFTNNISYKLIDNFTTFSSPTVNNTDAFLTSRVNHTGTQLSNTISDFDAAVTVLADISAANAAGPQYSISGTVDLPNTKYWRIFIPNNKTDIGDFNLYTDIGGTVPIASLSTAVVATTGTETLPVSNLFTIGQDISITKIGTTALYINFTTSSKINPVSYSFTERTGSTANFTDWSIEFSNDQITWVPLDTQTGVVWGGAVVKQIYAFPVGVYPPSPLIGQLFYNRSTQTEMRWSGTTWELATTQAATGIKTITANYILQDSDLNKHIEVNNTALTTITIPTGLDIGFNCNITQNSTGLVNISGATGIILNSRLNKYNTAGQFATISIISYGTDTFNVFGDTA